MVAKLTLDKLSTELIIKICTYLKIEDLCRLKKTCNRFNEIIKSWDNILCEDISNLMVTNQVNNIFVLNCFRKLKKIDKLRISQNWLKGKYFEKAFLHTKKKLIPYLQLSNEHLWISHGEDIFCYKRIHCNFNFRNPFSTYRGKKGIDVVNFKILNDTLVCGLRDGSIILQNLTDKDSFFKSQSCHTSDINSVDISGCGSTVISGSRDNDLKIWTLNNYDNLQCFLKPKISLHLQDLIWKVSFSEEMQSNVAVATAGNIYGCSLFIYNLNKMDQPLELLISNSGIRGISDVKWDGLHTLWSCGYDSYLRRWDLRTGKSEQHYEDPCGSGLYCLDYDYNNTVLTGAQLHGRVTLWDIRKGNSLQMYYMESCKNYYNRSSPVYSLAFDVDYLFTATDQNLNVLDFSVYNSLAKDYSFFLKESF